LGKVELGDVGIAPPKADPNSLSADRQAEFENLKINIC